MRLEVEQQNGRAPVGQQPRAPDQPEPVAVDAVHQHDRPGAAAAWQPPALQQRAACRRYADPLGVAQAVGRRPERRATWGGQQQARQQHCPDQAGNYGANQQRKPCEGMLLKEKTCTPGM